jgi:hypothetical protein
MAILVGLVGRMIFQSNLRLDFWGDFLRVLIFGW